MARILLADDESDIRRLIQDMLKGSGHELAAVPTGAMLLAVLDKGRELFDLVITDLNMPDWGGYPDAIRLRNKYNIPVIVITGGVRDLPDNPELPIVKKPFSIKKLTSAIERATE